MTMIDRIKQRMRELGINDYQLSKRMGYKGNSTIWSLLSGRTKTFRAMPRLAQALETTSDWLLNGEDRTPFAKGSSSPLFAAEPLIGHRSLDILGSTAPVEGRIMGLSSSLRSGQLDLKPLENTYAVEVAGNSMLPRFRHGEYALVVRDEWPSPHQDCLIRMASGEGIIKVYIDHNDKFLTYAQLNPKRELTISMNDVVKVEQIRGRWK